MPCPLLHPPPCASDHPAPPPPTTTTAGDPGLEDIYNWTASGQNVNMRGAVGGGQGVHVLTGPIWVCGAEPGDVLQVDILDLTPRKNPSTGKTFGSNAAANWG